MHPLKHPRNAIFVGLLFVGFGALYYGAAVVGNSHVIDWAGFTMLLALGAAMAVMAYVLIAGSPRS